MKPDKNDLRELVRMLLGENTTRRDTAWERLRPVGAGTLLPLLADELPRQDADGPDLWDLIDWQADNVLPKYLAAADGPLVVHHLLGHATPFSRRAGCRLLARLGPRPDPQSTADALAERLLHDEHHYVRMAAAEALAVLGGNACPVLSAVEKAARDDASPLVREAAGKAAARLGEVCVVRDIDAAAFEAEVVRSPVPVLVLFWAALSPVDRIMRQVVGRLAAAHEGARFVTVNIDDNPEMAAAHRLYATPTCLFFRGGQEVGRLVGPHKEGKLRETLDRLTGK